MSRGNNETTLQELKDLVVKFRGERNWDKHFTPKNVAASIVIEAAKLLEHFQWDEYSEQDKKEVAQEQADVLIFSFHFATVYDIDITTAFQAKLVAAAKKYPTNIFNHQNEGKAEYHRIKKHYRKYKT